MGCGGGQKAAKPQEQYQVEPQEEYHDNTTFKTTKSPSVPTPVVAVPLPSREKNCPVPLLKEVIIDDNTYAVSHYAPGPGLHGVTFVVFNMTSNLFYSCTFTDSEFTQFKEKNLPTGWNIVWRTIQGAFSKDDGLTIRNGGRTLEFALKKEKGLVFTFELDILKDASIWAHFINPFSESYQRRKLPPATLHSPESGKKVKEMKEDEAERREAAINVEEAAVIYYNDLHAGGLGKLDPLRESWQRIYGESSTLQTQVDKIVKNIRKLKEGNKIHPLDGLYSLGGPRPFTHCEFSNFHIPQEETHEPAWLRLMEDGRIEEATPTNVECLTRRPTDPDVIDMVEALPDDKVWQLIECFEHVDQWSYDCFLVDEITGGRSLFYTSYALFLKYGFMNKFNIPKELVVNFFTGVQAGYLPNAYHNSLHAADVMQITHYIITVGNMQSACRLTSEDCFAALIASAIHDYNHPGFNNNYHTKVSAYLGTLYNDRSVLENHHCATVFELMNHPKYDILQTMNDDQRKDIRDTVVEMMLSTDMGNHAKIFSAFKRRMGDGADWGKKKEDVRLALVIAIKLADISNCGRPTEIYQQWAKRICGEFYLQGDAEASMGLTISPFMNRRSHDSDFPAGQVSFMNYIVAPLFSSVSEMLPNMKFTLECLDKNKRLYKGGG